LECQEVEFSAAPVLVSIGDEELFVFCDTIAGHDGDVKTTILFVPHTVLFGFIERIIHISCHALNLAKSRAPCIANE